MARPRKEGLDYFPLDIHFDEKIKALEALHKNDGLVWIIKFWQSAYSTNSGEVNLNGIFGVIHAENSRITTGKQSEIINNCLEIGLITQKRAGVYTSNGIQKRLNMVVKDREIERKRKLVGSFPSENIPETGESKVKESKVKESKVNKRKENIQPSSKYDFYAVWALYPDKVGKSRAERVFRGSVKTDKDFDDIKKALTRYLASERVKNGYIQNGSTWFGQWRDWVDHVEPVKKERNNVRKFGTTEEQREREEALAKLS